MFVLVEFNGVFTVRCGKNWVVCGSLERALEWVEIFRRNEP